ILIILGVIFGAIFLLAGTGDDLEQFFQPDQFFLYLLPPIILEAAFSLHDRTFTDNLGSIIMFSVVGTVIACFAIGMSLVGLAKVGAMEDPQATPVQILVFSALIVAVDPVAVLAIFQEVGVNNMLYFLVFGESLLNDGVTVVLYNVMQIYSRMDTIEADQIVLGIVKFLVVVFGGIFIGVATGLSSSFLTRFTNNVKVVEPIIIFGFAYQSYIIAEMFHFSGIISIIGCGLTQMQYAFNNITNKSKLACKFFAKVISNTCEIIIFLFLGLKTVHPHHVWNTGFVLWTTLLCVLYRFIITFVMSFLINRCDRYRIRKIKLDEMFMISYGGLRGAVCFSLVALLDEGEFPMKNMFMTTSLFVIFFTVFIQGGTIKWLVKKMRVSLQDSSKDMILYQELNQHVSDHLMAGIEEIVGMSGKYLLREKFDRLDDRFIRPRLLRDPTKCDGIEISNYYEKLVMKEHYKNLRLCGVSNLPRVESDLRQIDSSVCLKGMDDEYEQRALERDEEIEMRRHRLVSQKSMKEAEGPEGIDLKKLFRSAMVSSRQRTGLHYHDKNFVADEKRNMVSHLRHKYKKNQRLSNFTPKVQRALSWDEDKTDLATRRSSDLKLNLRAGRAKTVDYSPLQSVSSDKVSSPPVFGLEDTVFEVEDEQQEGKPLLTNNNKTASVKNHENEHKHVTFEKQDEMDNTVVPQNNKAVNHNENIEGAVNRPGPPRSQSSQHSAHLLRQDAMKDPDTNVEIQMQDLGKDSKEMPNRQMSGCNL
ncbi:sodium/hydrogen exchanger 2-like, partial [Ruditapes philippinarum]|uniref:sodium/hydrogen exchanger 2-like n=1 Tax=Ruditapes philippinarum TaxID=129788 RepID=UPI00295B73E6